MTIYNTSVEGRQALTGDVLLNRVQNLGRLPHKEKAKYCGYSMVTEDGSEHINVLHFLIEVLKAKGIDLTQTEDQSADLSDEQCPTYRIAVRPNGDLEIDSAYIDMMGLLPGDELEILLDGHGLYLTAVSHTL